jgi:hypothetical protein
LFAVMGLSILVIVCELAILNVALARAWTSLLLLSALAALAILLVSERTADAQVPVGAEAEASQGGTLQRSSGLCTWSGEGQEGHSSTAPGSWAVALMIKGDRQAEWERARLVPT